MWWATVCTLLLVRVTAVQQQSENRAYIEVLRSKVLNRIDELWEETATWEFVFKKEPFLDADLVDKFRSICETIDYRKYPEVPHIVIEKVRRYALIEQERKIFLEIYEAFKKLDARPDPESYLGSQRTYVVAILTQFAHSVLSLQTRKTLAALQDMIEGEVEEHTNVFQDVVKKQEDFNCDVKQSQQQLLFNMYVTFQLTQLKAYTMINFSWMLLRLYGEGILKPESFKSNYFGRMSQQAHALITVMKDSKTDMWPCDPKKHIEGETFTRLTKFLQGYVVNEVDLNSENTCRENCAAFNYGTQHRCFKREFCAYQPRCRGNVFGCTSVDSDMWICRSANFTVRRYDWIEYENGRTLGTKQQCARRVRKVDSWWRYFWHCSYCFCYCDDPKDAKSDRFFSLRPVTADTEKNKVMTGLRFVKLNRIIHLQVQQGELLPYGEIDETTVEWVPVKEFGINDKGIRVGKDYHMLTWQQRALDLDDIQVPRNHLATGVRIGLLGGHMNFQVQGTEYNHTIGKLSQNVTKSRWFGYDNTNVSSKNPRTAHVLKNPDVPNRSSGLNQIDSQPHTFIEFSASDMDLDVGQTAVPFIDIQPVAPRPPTPLVGASVFHKGRRYSGGYIGLKVFTQSRVDHVQTRFFGRIL